jgi:hypothetical protein
LRACLVCFLKKNKLLSHSTHPYPATSANHKYDLEEKNTVPFSLVWKTAPPLPPLPRRRQRSGGPPPMGCAGSTPATKETGAGKGLRPRSPSSFTSRVICAVKVRGFLGEGNLDSWGSGCSWPHAQVAVLVGI